LLLSSIYEVKGYAFEDSVINRLQLDGYNSYFYLRDYAFVDCDINSIYFDILYALPCYKEGVYVSDGWWSGSHRETNIIKFSDSNGKQITVTKNGTTYTECDLTNSSHVFDIWKDYIYPSKVFECQYNKDSYDANYLYGSIDLYIGRYSEGAYKSYCNDIR